MTEIRQLQRRLDQQVLERAEVDPEWKRQLLEDPEAAMSGIPEARQLLEMLESTSPTAQPPEATMPATREEYLQLRRSLTEKVLDLAASDPQWKQQLLDDPETAMRTADFPEIQKLDEMPQSVEIPLESEVGGHVMPNPFPYSVNYYCCPFYTLAQTRLG